MAARRMYAKCAFCMVIGWLILLFVILFLQGFLGNSDKGMTMEYHGATLSFSQPVRFSLPQGVLIALVGGSTVSVLGFFAAVLNYLFPSRNNRAQK
jgi:hypothetical protein